ncbi:KN motif and ankyrin repeat domain-containing protein 4 [Ambystoma mexicanum]|uniref:KN motif and ankyrin repeat domain-containing protein 4 n=1 Tax=Ambystoma mexicanum TaxID=8296 RepID=UPI0037E90346
MERTNENNKSSKTCGKKEKQLPYSVETPYGFHLDLDFLKYVDDIEKGNTIKKIHISRRAKQPKFSTLPRNFSVPNNESRIYASSASYSATVKPRSTTHIREPVELQGTQSPPPVNASSHLRHLHDLNYRRKTNLVAADGQADIFMQEGFSTQNGRPNLFRATSMPAALPYDSSADEHSACPTFCHYPVTCQPCGGNGLDEHDFKPVEDSVIVNRANGLELAHQRERMSMKQQINEALQRIKELEEQVKTIPGLNQQIQLLTEEKLQLNHQVQFHQEKNKTLLSKAALSNKSETNGILISAAETSTLLTVSGGGLHENQESEEIELSISENTRRNSADSDIESGGASLAKHNVSLTPLLNMSLQHMVAKALRQKADLLEKQLNEKIDELEEARRKLRQREGEIEARDRRIQDLESRKQCLEECTKETQTSNQPEPKYKDVAVNTDPLPAKEPTETCDQCIAVNILPDTQSVGCGEWELNVTVPTVKELTGEPCAMDSGCQPSPSTTDTMDTDPDVVNENMLGNDEECQLEPAHSIMSDAMELKIEEPIFDSELQSNTSNVQYFAKVSAAESVLEEASSKTSGSKVFPPKNGVHGKEFTSKEQGTPQPDATVGQYVKKIQELIHEQWTCLEHGYPELAHAIRQPASKLSSIQNQLVNSLNLLSSVYTSQTSSDEEHVKTKCKEMETSPSTSLKSIMKKKGHGFHARGNGAKKNLQFVGVNGGYETTSSEEGSSSEETLDSDPEGKHDLPAQKCKSASSASLPAAPQMMHSVKRGDQDSHGRGGSTVDNPEQHPERSNLKEDFLHECQLLSNRLSEMGSTTDKETRESLRLVCKEWFRVSSQKSSSPPLVEAHLKEFRSISPRLLEKVLNMADGNGNTALHYSVSHSNFPIVKLLLDTGVCDVNHQNKAGYTAVMLTPLASAETDEDMKVVLRLLQQGDVNTRASKGGQTALILGVSHGRSDMVRVLLCCGADVNVQDDDGNSALMIACQNGHVEIIKLLLAQPGCNIALTNKVGNSALSIVSQSAHSSIAGLLQAHAETSSPPAL